MTIKSNKPAQNKQDQDDLFFDAYIEGDSPLSETYKAIDCAAPSKQLDRTILAAAKAAAEQASQGKSRWAQASSWAASIAIISLAGILAHNTWQAEEDALHQEIPIAKQDKILPEKKSMPVQPEAASIGADRKTQTFSRGKENISRDTTNDSRKLIYQSAPAPVMQSAPAYFNATKTKSLKQESRIQALQEQQFENSPERVIKRHEPLAKKAPKKPLTKQQTELNIISRLIESNNISQAQKLLLEFKTKYPDYPIDPVIIKHLSPY